MTLKELSEKGKKLNADMETLQAQLDAETDEAKKKVLGDMLAGKSKDFEAVEAQAVAVKAAATRAKKLAELDADAGADGSKKGKLDDGPVIVPDNQSAHNRLVNQKKLDQAAVSYLTCASKGGELTRAKWASELREAMTIVTPDGKERTKAPSYFSRFIVNPIRGKSIADLAACLGVMGKAYDVLTSDASGSQSGGGSLVPDTFIPELYRLPELESRLMDRCMVKRAINGTAYFPKLNQGTNRFGVAMHWGTEGSALTEDAPVFSRLSFACGRLGGYTQISLRELRVNNVGVEAELAWMFRNAMAQAIEIAILNGDGAGSRPVGINTNASLAAGVVRVARATASQVSYADLVNLQFAVEAALFESGIFLMKTGSTGALKYLAGLADSAGRPLMKHHDIGFQQGIARDVPTLAGSEFRANPDHPFVLGARGDVIYGDMKAYALGIEADVTVDRSDHVAFVEGMATFRVEGWVGGLPLGQTCFAVLDDVSGKSSSSSSSST